MVIVPPCFAPGTSGAGPLADGSKAPCCWLIPPDAPPWLLLLEDGLPHAVSPRATAVDTATAMLNRLTTSLSNLLTDAASGGAEDQKHHEPHPPAGPAPARGARCRARAPTGKQGRPRRKFARRRGGRPRQGGARGA